MKIAIVYDSRTGRTRQAALEMGELVRAAGHECTVESVEQADPAEVAAADAVCVGCWTKGLFFILQHPSQPALDFIDRLGPLDGKPAAVFCTYLTATGSTLGQIAERLSARGANVTGQLKSRRARAPDGFQAWVQNLGAAAA